MAVQTTLKSFGWMGINGISFKKNTFTDNETVSSAVIFFTTFLGVKPQNVVMENNFFTGDAGNQPIQMNFQITGKISNWSVRYNTFKGLAFMDSTSGSYTSASNIVYLGNILPRGDCYSGVTYTSNIGFGASGSACSGTGNSVATTAAMNFDTDGFHILTGSSAIGNGGSGADCIATDHDGNSRSSPCDAGAHQFTSASTPEAPTNFRLISWLGTLLGLGLLLGALNGLRDSLGGWLAAFVRTRKVDRRARAIVAGS